MACVNMYSPDGGAGFGGGGGQQPVLTPRISFSSDFAVEAPAAAAAVVQNRAMALRCQDEDLDFEFSVGSRPMMAADQLFSKGRILPLKDGAGAFAARPPTTLRDELRGGADDDRAAAASPKGSSSSRWKEMLGLRKALCVGGNAAAAATKKSDVANAAAIHDADMVVIDMAAPKQVVSSRIL